MTLSALFSTCISLSYMEIGNTVNYAVKREGRTLYIFFEDSDGKTDWKRNLDFPVKAYKRMQKTAWYAHRGFLRAWKEVEPALFADISDEKIQKIVVAGYSHGGAIALLCHEYIWFHRPDLRGNLEGYGFGCPRVIWKAGKSKQRWKNFCVIRNLDDLITHLPPAFLGFRHVGSLLKIGKRGKYSPIQAHYAENILRELLLYEKDKQNPTV